MKNNRKRVVCMMLAFMMLFSVCNISVETSAATKATQISGSTSRFIKKLGPIAARDYKNTGVLASVTMAQAILESGWARSSLARKANNLFGMKGKSSGGSYRGYRKYSSIEASVKDHSSHLLSARVGHRKRYAGLTSTKSYVRQLQIIRRGGYCTSSSYVSQLTRIIKRYNLTRWDRYTNVQLASSQTE